MIDLDYGGRAVGGSLEQVRPVASLPAGAIESDESGVDAHITAALVDLVDITGTGLGDERYPAGKLPLHLDVKVRGLFQAAEQIGNAVGAGQRALVFTVG